MKSGEGGKRKKAKGKEGPATKKKEMLLDASHRRPKGRNPLQKRGNVAASLKDRGTPTD